MSKRQAKLKTELQATRRTVLERFTVLRAGKELPLRNPSMRHPYAGNTHSTVAVSAHLLHQMMRTASGNSNERQRSGNPGDRKLIASSEDDAYQESHMNICPTCQKEAALVFTNQVVQFVRREEAYRANVRIAAYAALKVVVESMSLSQATRENLKMLRDEEDVARLIEEKYSFLFFNCVWHVLHSSTVEDLRSYSEQMLAARVCHLADRAMDMTPQRSRAIAERSQKRERLAAVAFAKKHQLLVQDESILRRDLTIEWLNQSTYVLQQHRAGASTAKSVARQRTKIENAKEFAKIVGSDVIASGKALIDQEQCAVWAQMLAVFIGGQENVKVQVKRRRCLEYCAKEVAARDGITHGAVAFMSGFVEEALIGLHQLSSIWRLASLCVSKSVNGAENLIMQEMETTERRETEAVEEVDFSDIRATGVLGGELLAVPSVSETSTQHAIFLSSACTVKLLEEV